MIKQSYSFDDLLLVPRYSEIESRSLVNTNVEINGIIYSQPIIPANMKTVVSLEMATQLASNKSLAILHRFMSLEEQLEMVKNLLQFGAEYFAVSVGVLEKDKSNISNFYNAGVRVFCIDIAHGDSKHCVEMIKFIKQFANTTVIAGNVATGEGASRLWKAGADIVKVGIGGGCFSGDTRILMSNGLYKNIKDVEIGDYVINKYGNPVKVLNSFCSGIKKVVAFKSNSFYKETVVTPEHKFYVGDLSSLSKNTVKSRGYKDCLLKNNKLKKSKLKWKELSKSKDDVLLFPKKVNFSLEKEFIIKLFKYNKLDFEIKPSYDLGYLFGTFLGDGCSIINEKKYTGKVVWYFGLNENDLVQKLSKCIKNIFNKDVVVKTTKNMNIVSFYYKPLADFLNSFGKKTNKKLPGNLIIDNTDYNKGIYDGLIDSDGYYLKDGRIEVSNTSVYIIELFNVITSILYNYVPNNSFRDNFGGKFKNKNISFSSKTLKSYKKRQLADFFIIKKSQLKDLEKEIPVYDLTVDCDSHSFIADNMIVHNSTCLTRVRTANGVAQMSAIMEVYEVKKKLEKIYDKKYYFISDGGCKEAGDICKALCFADMVMVGNLFAGTKEAPGNLITTNKGFFKEYVGSSTHKSSYVEGVKGMVPYKGDFADVLEELLEGIRSCCSYQGVNNLKDLKEDPQFLQISSSGLKESKAHDIEVFMV